MLECTVLYGRIILIALPFNILQIFFQSFFVTAEKPKLGLLTTVSAGVTNMVLDALLVVLLPLLWDIDGIWVSIIAAELMAVVFSVLFLILKRKKYGYF